MKTIQKAQQELNSLKNNIMKHCRIAPKEYIGENYIQDYYGYTKKESLKMYKEKFKCFTTKELEFI